MGQSALYIYYINTLYYPKGVKMNIYDITIAGVSGAAPSDGFIDPQTVYAYTNATPSDHPSTYATSLAKSRANRRNKNLINSIQFYSGMHIISMTVGGTPSCDVAPTSLIVRVEIGDVNSISVADESNAGATLTGLPAMKRIIARPLVNSETIMLEVLDPTTNNAPGVNNATAYARAGARFNIETVGPLYTTIAAAEASITLTLVS